MWSNPESYKFLAWPLILAWGIYMLREPIGRLIDRLAIKYERKGLHATTTAAQEQLDHEPVVLVSVVSASFFDPDLLGLYRAEVEKHLDAQKIGPGAARERELLDIAAGVAIVGSFERQYALIFGSQLAVLQVLNSAGETGFPIEVLKPWYELGCLKEPAFYTVYLFEQWIGFLEAGTLITRLSDGNVAISINGRGFLKYLIHQGYSMDKPN